MITDPEAKGYRPPGCDRGAGGSSACCSFGCAADRELLELASEPARAALHPEQIADLAARCGVKGSAAALAEFAALVREAEPMAPDEMRPAPVVSKQDEAPAQRQEKLLTLADKIDHEKLWQRSAMDRDKLTDDQQARLDAGVMLRRYADILQPSRWLIIPPTGSVQFSAGSLDKAYEIARRAAASQPGATNVLKIPLTLRPAAPGNPATCEVLDAADRVLATGFTPLEGSEAILRVNIHPELVSALRQARDVLLGHDELGAVKRVEGILAKAGAM